MRCHVKVQDTGNAACTSQQTRFVAGEKEEETKEQEKKKKLNEKRREERKQKYMTKEKTLGA